MATVFDLFILAIALILAAIGGKRGFIHEIFRFLALLGGFFGSFLYYRDLQSYLKPISSNQHVTSVLAFILLFLVVALVILGIGLLVKKFVHFTMFGWADRLLGVLLGIMKTAIIAWVACLSISSFPARKVHEEFGNSHVYKGYSQLPKSLNLSGLEEARRSIRRTLDFKSSGPARNTVDAIEELKKKVNSAKNQENSREQ
ncbi:MAG: CvpA family protein [Chitinispirillaceae bacterium]